jgi:hypothetical protein
LVFGVYLLVLGPALALVPNTVTRLVGIPGVHEPWLRLVGALALNLGLYYCVAAVRELRPIIAASVPARLAIPLWLLAFVWLADADVSTLVFGAADLVGALWTAASLRADRRSARSARS